MDLITYMVVLLILAQDGLFPCVFYVFFFLIVGSHSWHFVCGDLRLVTFQTENISIYICLCQLLRGIKPKTCFGP